MNHFFDEIYSCKLDFLNNTNLMVYIVHYRQIEVASIQEEAMICQGDAVPNGGGQGCDGGGRRVDEGLNREEVVTSVRIGEDNQEPNTEAARCC